MSDFDQVPFRIVESKNGIHLSGDLHQRHLRSVTSLIQNKIENKNQKIIRLDFSGCTKAFASTMLPIVAVCVRYRLLDAQFELTVPTSENLARLFVNANWAHFIDPKHFTANNDPYVGHLPALSYVDGAGQDDAINKILDLLLGAVQHLDKNSLTAVEWSLNEIADNVLNHSQSICGGMLQLTLFRNRRVVEYVVADAGIGIPKTLRTALPNLASDPEALRAAIEEGVTRNKLTNAGNGLFGSYRIANLSGGEFSINSGFASLNWSLRGGLRVRKEELNFPGTIVSCAIKYSEPELLQRALYFGGKPHATALDYVGTKYEEDRSGAIEFVLSKESPGFGSREVGKFLRTKLENLAALNPGKRIRVDFSGLIVISSSFADEVFGKLFSELGPMRFMATFELSNVDATVQTIIDRAIRQRSVV